LKRNGLKKRWGLGSRVWRLGVRRNEFTRGRGGAEEENTEGDFKGLFGRGERLRAGERSALNGFGRREVPCAAWWTDFHKSFPGIMAWLSKSAR